ncbi:MAG: flavodoxin family protein [Acholeplasmatales bacterium]|nr:flavodoxin family protein [Acholeplasmatales bacterium]
MKIVIIHGQNHLGSTYKIAHSLGEKIGGDVTEFFLPRDFNEFCVGCMTCFQKGEENCPHRLKLQPIIEAIDEADVIILSSPVYVFHVTGAMKAFLDHLGYRWMAHRPDEKMFKKQGIAITTAAGAGVKSTLKDMTDSLFYLGTGKVYKYGLALRAYSFDDLKDKKKRKIEKKTDKLAKKIKKKNGKVKPGFKTKAFFSIMRMIEKNNGTTEKDAIYWKSNGWLEKKRPWKNK